MKVMETNNNIDFAKTSQKSLDKTEMSISRKKSFLMTFNDKTTSDSATIKRRSEMGKVLFEIMNKLFSARVVLERLPNPVVQQLDPDEMQITKNENNGNVEISGSTVKRMHAMANTYFKVCPKCAKPFARRKINCDSCSSTLTFECQRCHKHFATYKRVELHVKSKCFLKGYYHCSACDFKTINTVRVRSHVEKLHPSLKFDKETIKWTDASEILTHECSNCGKKFDDHECLNKHIQLCKRAQDIIKLANSNIQVGWNKDFQKMIVKFCPKCQEDTKVYEGGVSSVQPCQKCGSAMKFRCSGCSKEYEAYSGCRYHTAVGCNPVKIEKPNPRHSSENSIHCPRCQKPFVERAWLERHTLNCKGPTNPKPRDRRTYKHLQATCERCCKVQRICDRRKICEKCKSSLRFQCKTCDKKFNADYDSWCGHLKSLYDQAKYVCNDCGQGMISRNTLLRHVKLCNKESLHCILCNYSTPSKHRLGRHMLLKHPILK